MVTTHKNSVNCNILMYYVIINVRLVAVNMQQSFEQLLSDFINVMLHVLLHGYTSSMIYRIPVMDIMHSISQLYKPVHY